MGTGIRHIFRRIEAGMATSEERLAQVTRFLDAVRHGDGAGARVMLDADPSLSRANIHTAAAAGDPDGVAAHLAAAPDCATRPSLPDGTEPIIYALLDDLKNALGVATADRVATVRLLLDAGASANASTALPDSGGRIPALYFPCASNDVGVARLLLQRGAATDDGESVHHAAQHNHRECLTLLAEFGANLSGGGTVHGNTPLYFLATHRANNPITPKAMLGMAWLLEHGADPNVPSVIAPSGGAVPGGSELPLHRIAASGLGADVATMLLDHGAIVDAPRGDGVTAYAMAVRHGNTEVAECLVRAGADVAKLTAVDRLLGAFATADEATARVIVARQPTIMAEVDAEGRRLLGDAIAAGRDAAAALMLSLGFPLDEEGEWGGTPLHWAAWNGRVGSVRQLLSHGAPINAPDSRYGSSPIAWAAHGSRFNDGANETDYITIVGLLLDAGAERAPSFNQWGEPPESLCSEGVTALLRARGFAS